MPPLYEPPQEKERYTLFAAEMEIREKRLRDFVAAVIREARAGGSAAQAAGAGQSV